MQYYKISMSKKNVGAVKRAVFYRIGFISHIKKYINYKKDGVYAENQKYKDFWRYILSFLRVKKEEICVEMLEIKNKVEVVM